MADKKSAAKAETKPAKKPQAKTVKKPNKVVKYFKDLKSEFKKVVSALPRKLSLTTPQSFLLQ